MIFLLKSINFIEVYCQGEINRLFPQISSVEFAQSRQHEKKFNPFSVYYICK